MHFKVAVRNFMLLVQAVDSLTDVLRIVSVFQGFGIEALEWNHSIHYSYLLHQFNSCAITNFQVIFQFSFKFTPKVYTILS